MSLALALWIVGFSGFIALSYEILWFRAFSFVSGGSPAAFGMLLGLYLAGLAVGALFSQIFCRDRTAAGGSRELTALAGFVFVANLFGFLVLPMLAWMVSGPLAAATIELGWGAGLPLVALSAAMMGAILPLVSHFGIAPDHLAGMRLSYLYLANILGSTAGSLVTGFVMMEMWPTPTIALILALLGLALSAGLLLAGLRRGRIATAAWLTIAVTALLFVVVTSPLFDRLYEKLLYKERWKQGQRFAQLIENRNGIIAVSPSGIVFGGGVYDGVVSTDLLSDRNNIVRAFGVVAIHPAPREILEIGLSTGAWAQVLSHLPGLEKLTIIEINPGYLKIIPQFPQVASFLRNPKVEVVIDDGRRWLARHPERKFDVIVSNTTFHWRAHATNLLSKEFLELVRTRLKPGGVFHFNPTGSNDVMKTAFTVFPHGLRFINFATVSDSPIVVDRDRWRETLSSLRIDERSVLDLRQDSDRRRFDELMSLATSLERTPVAYGLEARESVLANLPPDARLITDNNMASEWRFERRKVFHVVQWPVD